MGWLVFMGWVISQANEREDYSTYFGGGAEISRNWATAHFLIYDGWPQNCHAAGGCVIQLILMYYNECMRLNVHWKSTLLPSWTQLVLTSFCHVLWLCHIFCFLFLAALGLHCCARAFSSCGNWGLLFVAVHGLLIVVASLATEHGLQVHGLQQLWHLDSVVVARGLQSTGSVVVAHGLSCSIACGIFPDQGSKPCPLNWQADS